MATVPEYKQFISEFIRQQISTLGVNLVISTANRVGGLEVDSKGGVVTVGGDPSLILKDLFAEFVKLSPQLSGYFIRRFFAKYPHIAEEYSEPLPKSSFHCALIKPKL